jgi:hypothetical protein
MVLLGRVFEPIPELIHNAGVMKSDGEVWSTVSGDLIEVVESRKR